MKSPSAALATGIRLQGFAPVPNWLLCRHEVGDGAKLTFGRLLQYFGAKSECWPHQLTLADELGTNTRSIRRHLKELERHGLIRSVRHGFTAGNCYQLLRHPWHIETAEPGQSRATERPADLSGPPAESGRSHRPEVAAPLEEKNSEENIEEKHTRALAVVAFVPPSVEAVRTVADMQGIVPDAAEKFHAEAEAVGWVNKHGQPLLNWQAALRAYGVSWRAVDHRARASRPSSQPQRRPEARLIEQRIEPKVIVV